MSEEFTIDGGRWAELVAEAREAGAALVEAVEEFNAALAALAGFRRAVVADIEAALEARSEEWLESEAGEAAERLRAAWEDLELPRAVRVEELLEKLEGLDDLPTAADEA